MDLSLILKAIHLGKKSFPIKKNKNTKSLMILEIEYSKFFNCPFNYWYSRSKYSLRMVRKIISNWMNFYFLESLIFTLSLEWMYSSRMMQIFFIGKVNPNIIKSASAPYKQWQSFGENWCLLLLIHYMILCSPSPGQSDPVNIILRFFQ